MQSGTFGLTRGNDFVGAAIRLLTRSQVNHAVVIVEPDEHGPRYVEARASGAVITRGRPGGTVVYNDLEPLTDAQRTAVSDAALRLVGTPYGFLDIASLALVCLGIRWRWLMDRVQREDRLICSQLVTRAYVDAGVWLSLDGKPDSEVTPGDLLMYVAEHPWVYA